MRFQFYLLGQGTFGDPVLSRIGSEFERTVNNTIGTLRNDAIAVAEGRFAEIVMERQPGDGQIILMTPTLGEPPGAIIAVEVIEPFSSKTRLQWAWTDGSIQI